MLKVIREGSSGGFVPEVLTAGDNVYLDGFWQSEDYFKEHEQLIRRDFTFEAHSARPAPHSPARLLAAPRCPSMSGAATT